MAGRPPARSTIVDELLDSHFIKNESMTYAKLIIETRDNLSVVRWLAKHHLILNNMNCPKCGKAMTLNRYKRGIDGWQWRCNTDSTTRSIRWKSFFSNSHLSLHILLWMVYMWAFDFSQTTIAREASVNKNTVLDWCNFLREVCAKFLQDSGVDVCKAMMENPWMRYKKEEVLRQGEEGFFKNYISEYVWRQYTGPNKFGEIICAMYDSYSKNKP